MNKKTVKRVVSLALCSLLIGSLSACGGTSGGKNNHNNKYGKVYDETKTQLNVFTYKAGYGDEWLYKLEDDFEEAYKDYVFEDGKKGVQVWHEGDMVAYTSDTLKQAKYDIYFLENSDYVSLKNGHALMEITSAVTETNTDGKTIASKLTEQQQNYYGGSEATKKYYGVPSYAGSYGIIYNVELFEKKNLFVSAEYNPEDPESPFMAYEASDTTAKSKGPDGKTGVINGIDYSLDDGLPATYDEFFRLCDVIASMGKTPICWPGKYRDQHVTFLMDTLIAEYEGLNQELLNYSFDGKATNLIKMETLEINNEESDDFSFENDIKFETEELDITYDNASEISRQAGNVYGIEFIKQLIADASYYDKNKAFSATFEHTDNQQDFIMYGTELSTEKRDIAMLVDGPWWTAESAEIFEGMAKRGGEKYSVMNRKFGWMPLPKATKAKVGENSIFADELNALLCVSSSIKESLQEAALKFVQFANTDEQLVQFTQITGTVKGFKYSLTDEQKSKLSPFAKSVVSQWERSDFLTYIADNSFFNTHRTDLVPIAEHKYKSENNTKTPLGYFEIHSTDSAKLYFGNMYNFMKGKLANV